MSSPETIDISVVIPSYDGATTLPPLLAELDDLTTSAVTPGGLTFRVVDVVLVWDHGVPSTVPVLASLAERYEWVRVVNLSRNFGQHPATLAGIAQSQGAWVVTMDEDGQHDPADIAAMLDAAFTARAPLVYAAPVNPAPHSALRNLASKVTKRAVLPLLTGSPQVSFHSYRLIHGEHARAVAAYCGPGVYLDVALGWIIGEVTSCDVHLRAEGRPAAAYNPRRLLSHFWRLVLSSGTRPLRAVSGLGLGIAVLGLLLAAVLLVQRLAGPVAVQGWTSTVVALLLVGGAILISLGVIAEYVGMAAGMSMGRPSYVVVADPFAGRRGDE